MRPETRRVTDAFTRAWAHHMPGEPVTIDLVVVDTWEPNQAQASATWHDAEKRWLITLDSEHHPVAMWKHLWHEMAHIRLGHLVKRGDVTGARAVVTGEVARQAYKQGPQLDRERETDRWADHHRTEWEKTNGIDFE